jgi:hypothetical protein
MSIATQLLGEFGERVAPALLEADGFGDIYVMKANSPLWDVMAKRDSKIYAISVKARNKYTHTRTLNASYNLFTSQDDLDDLREMTQYMGFEFRWLAVQVDVKKQTYSAFFGTLEDIREPNSKQKTVRIGMTDAKTERYMCLARDVYHERIVPEMSNVGPEAGT